MEKAKQEAEPPSCLLPPIFMIGRDSSGNWVAQEKSGARGGLFISRAEALKFAKFESGAYPHAVVMVNGILELNISDIGRPDSGQRRANPVRHFRSVA